MKTAETILLEWGCEEDHHNIDKDTALCAMNEFAREVLDDLLNKVELFDKGDLYNYKAVPKYYIDLLKEQMA
jgi:hypothetical protein